MPEMTNINGEITLIRVVKTCDAAPRQWNAWDDRGRYWYLRFRGGRGSIGKDYDVDHAERKFIEPGQVDIELDELLRALEVNWRPDLYRKGMFLKPAPRDDPNAFQAPQDGEFYHLCDLPMHKHYIPYRFTDCNERGCWTWESKYRW